MRAEVLAPLAVVAVDDGEVAHATTVVMATSVTIRR
jgi:hypothetical protein